MTAPYRTPGEREEERAAVVAWLRAEAERFELHGRRTGEEGFWNQAAIERHDIADCIERGDHRKDTGK